MAKRLLRSHLEKLLPLLAIAEEGSFSRAAKSLNLSQPALSHSMKSLEHLLGIPLLVRERGGVSLTPEGTLLVEAAKKILEIADLAESKIQRLQEGLNAKLRLGTKEPFAIHLWPPFISWLKADKRNELLRFANSIELVIDKYNKRLTDAFRQRELDILLLAEPELPLTAKRRLLFSSDFRLYQSPLKPCSQKLFVYKQAIVNQGTRLEKRIPVLKESLQCIDVQSFDAARELAVQGLGMALLPDWLAQEKIREGTLQEVPKDPQFKEGEFARSKIYLCYQKEHSPTLSQLAEALQTYCQNRRLAILKNKTHRSIDHQTQSSSKH